MTWLPGPETFLAVTAAVVCMLICASVLVVLREGPLQPGKAASTLVTFVALFSIVIIQLPNLQTGAHATHLLVLVPFLLSIGWTMTRRQRAAGPYTVGAVALFIVMASTTVLRGAFLGASLSTKDATITATTYVVLAVFGVLMFEAATDDERRARLIALALAPTVFVVINIVLKQAGPYLPLKLSAPVGSAGGTTATLLNDLGFKGALRTAYPLTSGVNSMGAIAGAGLTAAVALGWRIRRMRSVCVVSALACLYTMLSTDSRTALLFSIAIIVLLLTRRRIRGTSGLTILLPLAPVVLIIGLSLLSGTGAATTLSRNRLEVGNSARVTIWKTVWQTNLDHPSINNIFGYGANGQLTSGVEAHYIYLFGEGGSAGGAIVTTHDLYIQTVLDSGYIGLILLVMVAGITLLRLSNSDSEVSPILGGALLVLLLCGTTEALPTYNFPDCMALFVLLITADAASPIRNRVNRKRVDASNSAISSRPSASGSMPSPVTH